MISLQACTLSSRETADGVLLAFDTADALSTAFSRSGTGAFALMKAALPQPPAKPAPHETRTKARFLMAGCPPPRPIPSTVRRQATPRQGCVPSPGLKLPPAAASPPRLG